MASQKLKTEAPHYPAILRRGEHPKRWLTAAYPQHEKEDAEQLPSTPEGSTNGVQPHGETLFSRHKEGRSDTWSTVEDTAQRTVTTQNEPNTVGSHFRGAPRIGFTDTASRTVGVGGRAGKASCLVGVC